MPHKDSQSNNNYFSVRILLDDAVQRLSAAGIDDSTVDAELLLAHVLGVSRGRVQALHVLDAPIEAAHADRFRAFIQRRTEREPLQHLTGVAFFRALALEVGPGVFIPRPETEQVVQYAIDALRACAQPIPVGVDLGTGSGAIALAMATEVPHAQIYAIENSPQAFVWAQRNIQRLSLGNVRALFSDISTALPEVTHGVDVVISNPPYIPDRAVPRDPEVRLFDPAAALYGGADGLDTVRVVSRVAWRLLKPGGTLVIEHGELQGEAIRLILADGGWRSVRTHPDLTMRDRATTALR